MEKQELEAVTRDFFPSATDIKIVDFDKQRVSFIKHGDYYLIAVDSAHAITHLKQEQRVITADEFHAVSALPARFTRATQSFRVTFHIGELFAVVKMYSIKGDYHSYTVSKNCNLTKGFDNLLPSKLGHTATDIRHAVRLLHSKPRKVKQNA